MIGKRNDVSKFMHILSVLMIAVWVSLAIAAAAAPENPRQSPAQLPGSDVETLIRELGDESFSVREKATRAIWTHGKTALPALQKAINSSAPEQAFRARELLRKIQLDITPDTDPTVIDLVEGYFKASPTEKVSILGKMKDKQAWRQMLKLYAMETPAELREKLAPDMDDIASRAASQRLHEGDDAGAQEFLEMAPANAAGLLALAEFHRSHGTLAAELVKARTVPGRKGKCWLLALERAAGNFQAARDAAMAAGESQIAAAMAALMGDPLPWLREPGKSANVRGPAAVYAGLAVKRWSGERISPVDMESLMRLLKARSASDRRAALNALFLLGEVAVAEPAFAKTEPLLALRYFDSLERIPEAFQALGLEPDQPDYQPWIEKRVAAILADEIEDQHEVSTTREELLSLAYLLERRGLYEEAYNAFSVPLAKLAAKNPDHFQNFLRALFGSNDPMSGAPILAKRIGVSWAGKVDGRWNDLVVAAFGDGDSSSAWWSWLQELDPKASPEARLDGMLALYGIGPDPKKLRARWLALAWKAVEVAPEENRAALVERMSDLLAQTGDVANSFRAWQQLAEESRNRYFWVLHIVHLSALDRWNDAANLILKQLEVVNAAKQDPSAELHAYAAAALRRAGRGDEAAIHDGWADKLALGDSSHAMRIGNSYAYGCDYKRAGDWWSRAACEADPESGEFPVAFKLHADALLDGGRWKEAAAVSEVVAQIFAISDYHGANGSTPLPFMHERLQADSARALANLKTDRAGSIALLEQCHRNFVSDGTLADFFFPALRKAGLIKEHDRWFDKTWSLLDGVIRKYPHAANTRNTAAWFAARTLLRLDTAEKFLSSALAMNPEQSAYLDTMAEIQFAMGHRDKALEWSKLAVNFSPDDPQLRRQQERFRSEPLPKR